MASVVFHQLFHHVNQRIQAAVGVGLRFSELADTPVSLLAVTSERKAYIDQLADPLPVFIGEPCGLGLLGGYFSMFRFNGSQIGPELGLLLGHELLPGFEIVGHGRILAWIRSQKACAEHATTNTAAANADHPAGGA